MEERIGPYTIESELGRGGMGVVYRASDPRLGRTVAIKALPEELAQDAGRLERFEREARTLAQLNHPNIGGIHGLEEHGGRRYLVLEFVEGETLADRLDRGVLEVDEAVELAAQIAAGVEAAHNAGVVHRDLKPGNIMITPEGRAKVLDFGLARSDEAASSTGSGLSQSPTLTTPQHSPTVPGVILGTAAYMSPEQARGRRVDRRGDIWSFGVILYEMLVGISPFAGETASDSIGAVLHKSFSLERLPPGTPANVRRVLRRCLQRDKEQRYRDIGDARLELLGGSVDVESHAAAGGAIRLVAAVALTAVLAAGAAWVVRSALDQKPTHRPLAVSIDLGGKYELHQNPRPKLSPDGRRLLLRVQDEQRQYLVMRELDTDGFVEVIDGENVGSYGFSPDGEWMFYDDEDGRLRKLPLNGGPPVTICNVRSMNGGVWTKDNEIIFNGFWQEPLRRVSADGGEPEPMYEKQPMNGVPAHEIFDGFPMVDPSGKWVVFNRLSGPGWDNVFLMIMPIEGGPPRPLVRSANRGRFLDTGHLIFQREDTLMAVAFDAARGEVGPTEAPVLRGVDGSEQWNSARFDLLPDGTLVYVPGKIDNSEIEAGTLSLQGEWASMGITASDDSEFVMSDDDRYLATRTRESDRMKIEITEVARDVTLPVPGLSERELDSSPVWHPDGRTLYFNRRGAGGRWTLNRYRVGTVTVEALAEEVDNREVLSPESFTRDGKTLVGLAGLRGEQPNLSVLRFDDDGGLVDEFPEQLLERPGRQWRARLSPDDRWLAFGSTPAGQEEIFVVSMENPGEHVQVSTGGGNFFTWDPNENRLYYLYERNTPITMYAVDFTVSEAGEFVPGLPAPLFELEGFNDVDWLDMNAAGTRFYVTRDVAEEGPELPNIPRVIVEWDELIRDQLPR